MLWRQHETVLCQGDLCDVDISILSYYDKLTDVTFLNLLIVEIIYFPVPSEGRAQVWFCAGHSLFNKLLLGMCCEQSPYCVFNVLCGEKRWIVIIFCSAHPEFLMKAEYIFFETSVLSAFKTRKRRLSLEFFSCSSLLWRRCVNLLDGNYLWLHGRSFIVQGQTTAVVLHTTNKAFNF